MDTNKRYIFVSALLLVAALILVFLPRVKYSYELTPEELLLHVVENTQMVSTDYLAKQIIDGDPSIQLIDVRTPEEYAAFSLPGAINIPLADFMAKDEKGKYKWEGYLNQQARKNIFYSNGTVYANQAWLLCRRLDYENNFVLEGGLNYWMETIMRPTKPAQTDDKAVWNLYSFRKAAAAYFGGGTVTVANESSDKKPEIVIPKKKNTQTEEVGGC